MKRIATAVLVLLFACFAFAAEDVVEATHGTISKIDQATKTVVIKTADGVEHAYHWTKNTAVHGAEAAETGAKDSWHGLKEGSEVVAHTTKRGGEDTAVEVDKVGDDGLQKTEGTIKQIDRGGKKLVIEGADGTEHTYQLSAHAAEDAGKGLKAGTAKGTKVVVYSTETSGKKVAHFFEKL